MFDMSGLTGFVIGILFSLTVMPAVLGVVEKGISGAGSMIGGH